MFINLVRSRRIISPVVLAAAALLGLSGCNSGGNSGTTVTPTSLALSSNVTSVNLGGTVTLTASLGSSTGGTAAIGVVTFYDGANALQATSITGSTTVSTTRPSPLASTTLPPRMQATSPTAPAPRTRSPLRYTRVPQPRSQPHPPWH